MFVVTYRIAKLVNVPANGFPVRTGLHLHVIMISDGLLLIFPYQKVCLIYNPYAGGLRGVRMGRLDRAQKLLETFAGTVKRYQTDGPKTAGMIARKCISKGADLVIAAGGDGTINEVAGGMVGSNVPLAILPGGTANVLANEIGLGGRLMSAVEQLPRCQPRRVPMGRITRKGVKHEQHFLLMAGAGLDAHIVFHLDPVLKARFGKLAYWAGGLGQFLRNLEEFELEADGQKHVCSFALISKVRNYGGDFEIAREVRIDDDTFEIVLFEGSNPWRYLVYLSAVALRRTRGLPGVKTIRASEVTMRPCNGDQVHLQVDGEHAGRLPARVSAVPDALTLLLPPEYGR
jgi:diacylglycerol kinase (ATP)